MNKLAGILALSLALAPLTAVIDTGVSVSAVNAEDMITITGGTEVPVSISAKQKVSVRGTVKSGSTNITKLMVGIYDANGKAMSGGSVTPNSKSYDLSKLDKYVEFNKLPAGKYTYRVFVTNGSETNYSLVNQAFIVTGGDEASAAPAAAASSMKLTGASKIPDRIAVGGKVSVYGSISSDSKITSVTVGVFGTDGKLATGIKTSPNSKSFNIKALDKYIKFDTLKSGTYIYRVTASNSDYSNHVLEEKTFVVGNGAAAATTKKTSSSSTGVSTANASAGGITLKNGTELPAHLNKGKSLRVTGTVSANSKIATVTVGVFFEDGKLATGIKTSPNRNSYSLSELDKYVYFNKLDDGIYYYRITAALEGGDTEVLVQKKFAVGSAELSSASAVYDGEDDEYIGDDEPVEGELEGDEELDDDGSLEDDDGSLTDDSSDTATSGDDLTADDSEEIIISDDDDEEIIADDDEELADEDDEVPADDEYEEEASASDTMSASGVVDLPSTIKEGRTFSVYGKVTSSTTKLTSVTAGIFNTNGKLITGRTSAASSKTYDISVLDKYIRFNDLSAGTYVFKIVASNGDEEDVTVYEKQFRITK